LRGETAGVGGFSLTGDVTGGDFIPTFENLDLRSLTPCVSGGGEVDGIGPGIACAGCGVGRNLFATDNPAFRSLIPKLFGSLLHFLPMFAAVWASCLFGGVLSVGGGSILFATFRPAFASANVRLFGSLRYF